MTRSCECLNLLDAMHHITKWRLNGFFHCIMPMTFGRIRSEYGIYPPSVFFYTFFYYRPELFNNGAYVGWFSLPDIEVVARIRIAYQRCFQGFNLWPLARTTAKSFVLFLFLYFTSTNAFYHGRFHHYSCTFMVLAATSPTSSLTRHQVCDTVSEEESFLQKKDIKRLALGRYHWLFFLRCFFGYYRTSADADVMDAIIH